MNYAEFLEAKTRTDRPSGFDAPELSAHLFPFQADLVRWALRRGRAAIFADCGMGKTLMQLEWGHRVSERTGLPVLILAPLAVSNQTVREAAKFGIDARVVRDQDQVGPGINVTNYEMLGHFDPAHFAGVVLDESSILKNYTGSTRTAIIEAFRQTPYRLACTATPAPNDFVELGNHAEFLGAMSRVEMLSMFFVHDGGSTQDWRLKGHAQRDFWRWVCSWGAMIRKPSDLGYSDDGFALPELKIIEHVVDVAPMDAGLLFDSDSMDLNARRAARKSSIDARVAVAAKLAEDGDRWAMWCGLNAESEALHDSIPDAVEVSGSDSAEFKESALFDFAEGRARVLVTKSSIAGFGMNFQSCARVALVGMSDSYESMYQVIRRCWRFGQKRPVEVHIITASSEGAVLANVKRKEQQAREMGDRMAALMGDVIREQVKPTGRLMNEYEREEMSGRKWRMVLGDCVESIKAMQDGSVGYSIFSPPFASLYTYSASDRDMGNCADHDEFARHFAFLVPELLRVTKPGRLLSFHCMQLPTSKVRDGVIGLRDFRGELIRAFTDAGWIYHSEVAIWKDPVTAMQRTKALGLLHKQIRKDSCMSRQGIADYVVTMRKPGDNPDPVSHTSEEFPVSDWQHYASPIWMDINPNDTLQARSARDDEDERHICPLQLEVIRRCLRLWSKPGDIVLSPFAGIGSEGYESVKAGRQFIGFELKRTYFAQACANLAAAEGATQGDMFEAVETAASGEWPR